jgi:hypothetical protein
LLTWRALSIHPYALARAAAAARGGAGLAGRAVRFSGSDGRNSAETDNDMDIYDDTEDGDEYDEEGGGEYGDDEGYSDEEEEEEEGADTWEALEQSLVGTDG